MNKKILLIALSILTGLNSLIMLTTIIYTIFTGQFHALPKEFIIFIVFMVVFILLIKTFKLNNKNEMQDNEDKIQEISQIQNKEAPKLKKVPPLLDGKEKEIVTELPETYFDYPLVYNYSDVKICMLKDFDMTLLRVGYSLTLKQEPENEYDKTAVAIYCYQVKIGYMYKNKLQDMANDFSKKQNSLPYLYISKIEENDVYMNLGFYGRCLMKYENQTEFNLTNASKKEIQENLDYSCEGNEIIFEYDYEKESYAATDGGTIIGYAPKSKSKIFEECKSYYAEIKELDTNENDKYYATVILKYN